MAGFGDDVEKWVAETNKKIELAVRQISLSVFTSVILRSPVDTGRFRGNWQVKIGSIPTGTLALDDKTGTVTISKAQAATLSLKVGQVIYLINNLDYAEALENGWSAQAPNGMVKLTVQEFQPIVDKVVRDIQRG